MAGGIIPTPRAVAQQVVIALVVTLTIAWLVGHSPGLRAWLQRENDGTA